MKQSMQPPRHIARDYREYQRGTVTARTRQLYAADLRHFKRWGGKIPATPAQVASYLARYAGQLAVATLARRLIAISRAHTERNHATPVADPRVKTTFRGIKRTFGTAQKQAIPLLDFQLNRVVGKCGKSLVDLRDRAMLALGFAAALRRAELVAVTIEDIQQTRRGLVLNIPFSKTDQERRGRKLAVPRIDGKHCPVKALNAWLRASRIGTGRVFRRIDRHGHIGGNGLHPSAVGDILRKRLTLAGIDATGFSAHSLRAGLATSAARAGVPSWKIRQQTGHKSDATLSRYIRDQQIFENNAAAAVFLRMRRSHAKFSH